MNKTEVKMEVISWIKTIGVAVLLAVVINMVLIVNAEVPTGSMKNTIMEEDRIVALRTSYWFDKPERGDIVVFRYPDDPTGETLFVKRIMGVGGDELYMEDGILYRNGEALEESYIMEEMQGDFGPITVPEEMYFMMGDNRNDSLDSRAWDNKFVEEGEILGKVVWRYFRGFKVLS